MKKEVSTKTITEVNKTDSTFQITCFSDMNTDGTTTPALFKSQVLNKPMEIDSVNGLEGELLLSHSGDTVGAMNSNGELSIELEGDDVDKYDKSNENLIYNE